MQSDPAQAWTPSESERLEVLRMLDLLDGQPVSTLDALVQAARAATGRRIALVSLVDDQAAHHVSRDGLDTLSTPKALAFCSLAIRSDEFYEISDLRADPRFAQHPLVDTAQGLRHYAAAQLRVDGHALGTLCVLDHEPGPLPLQARATLLCLAEAAAQWLDLQHRHRRLENQAERLVDLVRAAGDWAWESDEHDRLIWIDGELLRITGLDPAELLGQPMQREPLVDGGGQELPQGGDLLQVLERRQAFSRLVTAMDCPRGRLLVSRSAQPVFDLQGRFRGYRGSARDITARVERDKLWRDRAALEAVHRSRSAFLSRVSHELRTPLNAILGFTQLMAMDTQHPLAAPQAQRLDGVRRAGQHLLELVDDVLEVVRLGQGGRQLASVALALAPLATRAMQPLQAMADLAQVTVRVDIDPALQVLGDEAGIGQVLGHLLSNAIKYNRPGGRVRLAASRQGPWVRLTVEDTGIGLAPGELQQLFQPFQRAGAERRRVPGSGLGLVLVRELVGAMRGQVDATSTAGVGSCFSVELPAPEGAAAPATAQPRPARRVLYIEDEPLNVLLMQEVFKARPEWELRVGRDGEEGLTLAQSWQPHLALIDMNLPDMNGLEVLRRLRADERTRTLRCVALSADAMSEQVQSARAAGFDDYWTKPIDLNHLLDAVGRAIDGA
ncbi:response regulator [Ideonella sp. 4Y16]|uniref:hybrid sensor histidine kinase/response regulator n=1 Tax=Ideonella alba TaxID=2824118 RepID=UPI001B35FBFA|nr:ATP-binding protein [Ideonella alba]MBQ0943505.1 response regulator [Ideonella alba]